MSFQYFVFAGDFYYPMGGMADFVSAHQTEDEADDVARQYVIDHGYSWSQVADVVGELIVREYVSRYQDGVAEAHRVK